MIQKKNGDSETDGYPNTLFLVGWLFRKKNEGEIIARVC